MIVEVAINLPIRKCFDYCWPENLDQVPEAGLQVLVPFGRQKKGGIIVGVNKKSKFPRDIKGEPPQDPSSPAGTVLGVLSEDTCWSFLPKLSVKKSLKIHKLCGFTRFFQNFFVEPSEILRKFSS